MWQRDDYEDYFCYWLNDMGFCDGSVLHVLVFAVSDLNYLIYCNKSITFRFTLLPLFMNLWKDVRHSCSKCNAHLGVYRRM